MKVYSEMRNRVIKNFSNYNKEQSFEMLMHFIDQLEAKDLEIDALNKQLFIEQNNRNEIINAELNGIFVNLDGLDDETVRLMAKTHTKKNVSKAAKYADDLVVEAKKHKVALEERYEEEAKISYANKIHNIEIEVEQEKANLLIDAQNKADEIIEVAELEKQNIISSAMSEEERIIARATAEKQKMLLAIDTKREKVTSEIELKILKAENDINKLKEEKLKSAMKLEHEAKYKFDKVSHTLTHAANQNQVIAKNLYEIELKQKELYKKLLLLIDFTQEEILNSDSKSKKLSQEIRIDETQSDKIKQLHTKEANLLRQLEEIIAELRQKKTP